MLKKTSDIVINTKEDQVIPCPYCGEYIKINDKQHKCKNCNSNKDIENERSDKVPNS